MTAIDIRPQLGALLGHLNGHPDLVAVTLTGEVVNDEVATVHAFSDDDGDRIPVLAAWLRSLDEVEPVRVDSVSSSRTHVSAVGCIPGTGVRVRVKVILGLDEFEVLATNTPVEVGASFPVELLYLLADHAPVKPVSAGAVAVAS